MKNKKSRYHIILQKLKDNGHRITPQRMAIVKHLAETASHPSVEHIYNELKSDFPTMSIATVYRNIIIIESLGEVLALGFPDGSNRYDGRKPYPHPHIVCIRCQKIAEPDILNLENLTQKVSEETHFKILNHRLDFFGICDECQKKKII